MGGGETPAVMAPTPDPPSPTTRVSPMMEAAFACRTRVAAELDAFLVPAATLPPEQSNLGKASIAAML